MPYYSNREINERPVGYKTAYIREDGVCMPPQCCGKNMIDDGGCSEGCCDDYLCESCGHSVRIEWPD